jgi:hypothetical protein
MRVFLRARTCTFWGLQRMSRLGAGIALLVAAAIAAVATMLASFTPAAGEHTPTPSPNMGIIWFAAGTLVLLVLLTLVLRMKLRSRASAPPSQISAEPLVPSAA